MKIGVVDSYGTFHHQFFSGKKLIIHNLVKTPSEKFQNTFSHSELVCASIFYENPDAEVSLYTIYDGSTKYVGEQLITSIEALIAEKVEIIHLSLGIEEESVQELETVCAKAEQEGIYIVASNSNSSVASYPACMKQVLGVNHDESEKEYVLRYDDKQRNIYFCHEYTQFYYLGIKTIQAGNSFLAPKISGVMSKMLKEKEEISTFFQDFLDSDGNRQLGDVYMKKPSIYISNYSKENYDKEYVEKCLNCKDILCIQDEQDELLIELKQLNEGVYIIDIDDYNIWLMNEKKIEKILEVSLDYNNIVFFRKINYPIYKQVELWKRKIKVSQLLF